MTLDIEHMLVILYSELARVESEILALDGPAHANDRHRVKRAHGRSIQRAGYHCRKKSNPTRAHRTRRATPPPSI